MAAFRILDPFPAYQNALGAPAAGGSLKFYETGTATVKNVYGDKALTINNGNTITLDSSGRTNVDVWGDGAYRVRLLDSLGAQIDEADNVELPGGAATSLPAMVSGKFLTNDGSVHSWASISQLPDMTGSNGRYLTTDGTLATWGTLVVPTLPATGIATTANGYRVGTVLTQTGTGSFAASGTQASSVVLTFGTAFNAAPYYVGIQMHGNSMYLHARVDSITATTANLSVDSNIIGELITASQSFRYIAIGPVT